MRSSGAFLCYSFLIFIGTIGNLLAQNTPRLYYDHIKISSTEGNFKAELPDEAAFGQGLAMIGDLNKDGIPELAVGAPGDGLGSVWILFLNDSLEVESHQKISQTEGNFEGSLTEAGMFGTKIEALGDWDGDSIPDILVSEPQAKTGPIAYGGLWILLLQRDGTVKNQYLISGRTEGFIGQLGHDYRFGYASAALGDCNGDGVGDIAVSAPMQSEKGTGRVWILYLTASATIQESFLLNPEEGLRKGDHFGASIESIGDLDQDGLPEIAIGATGDDGAGLNRGALWIFYMNNQYKVRKHHKIIPLQSGFQAHINDDDRWGKAVCGLGDWNGDTIPDILVSAHLDDDNGKDRGGAYILYMNEDGSVKGGHKISETTRNFLGKFGHQYQWGWSVNPCLDLNQDGRNEILMSGHRDDDGGKNRGAAWILFPTPKRLAGISDEFDMRELKLTAEDSARIYRNAISPEDSARIDSMYDLSGFAPSNLVLMLDVSASMNKPGRLPLLRDAFLNLLAYMRPEDIISIVVYSGKAATVIDGMSASERGTIETTIADLSSAGSTKPAKALRMSYALARKHYISNGNNRIIFATDGGFPSEELDAPLEKGATEDIPLSVFYFGKLPAYKISEMEDIARRGFGNVAHINPLTAEPALVNEVKVIQKKN